MGTVHGYGGYSRRGPCRDTWERVRTESDRKGIKQRGAAARQAGADFHENPFYFTSGAFEE